MKSLNNRQKGASILLIVATLTLATSWVFYQLYGDLGAELKKKMIQDTNKALVDAKINLLTYAESIPELYSGTTSKQGPGFLPCPDGSDLNASNGGSSGTCAWTSSTNFSLGRLPSAKLTGQFFFFSTHEKQGGIPIWYAVDDAYRYCGNGTSCANNVNPLTLSPTLTLDGQAVVAILISPGLPLAGNINGVNKQQIRNRSENTYSQWDDHIESMTSLKNFVSSQSDPTKRFNDVVLGITKSDFDQHIKNKVCTLALTYCGIAAPNWFNDYGWRTRACTGLVVNPAFCNM